MEQTDSNTLDMRHLPDSQVPCKKVTPSKPYKLKSGKTFVKGPIDLNWISAVAHLPGKALNVGMALMWLSGLNKSMTSLKLTKTAYSLFNISRSTCLKALKNMEYAGLISVERGPGRKNRITILEAPPPKE